MTTQDHTPRDPTPRERGRQTCRAAYMAIINLHHQVNLENLCMAGDPTSAALIADRITAAVAGMEQLDGLRGDICEPDLLAQIQLDDISAAVRRALNAAPDDTRPPLALVADLIEIVEHARTEIGPLRRQLRAAMADDPPRPRSSQFAVGQRAKWSDGDGHAILVKTGEEVTRGHQTFNVWQVEGSEVKVLIARGVRIEPADAGSLDAASAGGFTPRTEISEVKPAVFDAAADRYIADIASGPSRDFVKLKPGEPEETPPLHGMGYWRQPPPGYRNESDREYRNRLMKNGKSVYEATKIALDGGCDAGSEDPEIGALIEAHARDTADTARWVQEQTSLRISSRLVLNGRLMTADDFKTPEEFEIYRAGADRLPLGVLPGSWEGHLLTAMAAMAAAGIERHEARMTPDVVVNAEHPHPELLAFRRWAEAKVASNGHKAAMLSGQRLRGEVDKVIEVQVAKIDRLAADIDRARETQAKTDKALREIRALVDRGAHSPTLTYDLLMEIDALAKGVL